MEQVVRFLTTTTQTANSYLFDQYQLRTDMKHVWLQKAAIWILRKLKCYAIRTDTIAIKHTIDPPELAQRIWKQHQELMATYHYRGSRLLVGYEEFQALGGFHLNHPLSLTAPYYWQESTPTPEDPYSMHRTQCGLKVTVIPWMKGVLVLPKDMKWED